VFSFSVVSLFSIINLSFATLISFIIFGVIGMVVCLVQRRVGVALFIIIYSATVVIAVILYYIFELQYGTPYGGGGSDSLGYERLAEIVKNSVSIYNSEEIGIAINMPYHNSKGYVYFISLLMKWSDLFDGFHTMIPRLFNSMLLALCSVQVYSISLKLHLSRKLAFNAALVTGLFPMMVYVAAQSFRDIPIVIILLSSVYLSTAFIQSRSGIARILLLLGFVPLILIIMEFRLLNAINIGLMAGVAVIVGIFRIRRISNAQIFSALLITVIGFNLMAFSDLPLILDLLSKLDSSGTDLTEGVDRASEGGLSLILFNLPVPFNYIGSLFYSFITPLPILYTRDVDWNYLSLGTIYQFVFVPFIFLGLSKLFRLGQFLPVFTMFLLCFVGYVFGSFTFRHLTYIVPFAAIYGAAGYEVFRKQRHLILQSMGSILILLMAMYYLIKI
jgi:hypothetical protein